GLGVDDFLQMAQLRGMPSAEVEKPRSRVQQLELAGTARRSTNVSRRDPRQQLDVNEITRGLYQPQEEVGSASGESEIFGSSLCYPKNRRLSFEPSLNQATPKNYVLGPGDVVFVDI